MSRLYGIQYHMEEAYLEAGITKLAIPNPKYALFSHKYVNEINNLDHTKKFDYCFMGAIKDGSRGWIIDFCKKYFTSNSVYVNTDITDPNNYQLIGNYDYTIQNMKDCF